MRITLNGEPQDTTAETVTELLGDRGARGCAVAVNGRVVARSDHATTRLTDGDAVEIVTAVQGG